MREFVRRVVGAWASCQDWLYRVQVRVARASVPAERVQPPDTGAYIRPLDIPVDHTPRPRWGPNRKLRAVWDQALRAQQNDLK